MGITQASGGCFPAGSKIRDSRLVRGILARSCDLRLTRGPPSGASDLMLDKRRFSALLFRQAQTHLSRNGAVAGCVKQVKGQRRRYTPSLAVAGTDRGLLGTRQRRLTHEASV
jgi:hypothetical protein